MGAPPFRLQKGGLLARLALRCVCDRSAWFLSLASATTQLISRARSIGVPPPRGVPYVKIEWGGGA